MVLSNQSPATEKIGALPFEGVEAVDRAFRIVDCCASSEKSLGLTALATQAGLYKSTVLRLLSSLRRAGLIEQLPDKTYKLGPEIMRLSAAYQRHGNFEQNARSVLRRIVATTGESASLHKLVDGNRLCLFRENSKHHLRDHVNEGSTQSIKLAGASSSVLKSFHHVTNAEISPALVDLLPMCSFGQPNVGVFALSTPVFNRWGTMEGALTISGPTSRLTKSNFLKFAHLVMQEGNQLSRILGAPAETWLRDYQSDVKLEKLFRKQLI